MELIFLCVNLVMLIIVLDFAVSIVWRWKSKSSIESQITNLAFAALLVICGIVQLILAIMIGENIILAILQIGIWILSVITLSIYLRKTIKTMKANKKSE